MSSVTRPRGQLPARVYWVRRVLVVVVLAVTSGLVVVGLATFLGTGGEQPGAARQAAAGTGTTPSSGDAGDAGDARPSASATPLVTPTATPSTKKERRAARRAERLEAASPSAEPVVPQGACEPSAVRISSRVSDAFAATDIEVPLDVITLGAVPCTWEFSADTVALDITSGGDRVWSSVDCPGKVPEEEIVLVPGTSEPVTFTWNGQRSDRDCTRSAEFAYPGWYHVLVAAEGGEPYDQQFELTLAPDETVTRTPSPKPRTDPQAEESEQAQVQTTGGAEGRTKSEGRAGD